MNTTEIIIFSVVLFFFGFVIYKFTDSHKDEKKHPFNGVVVDPPPTFDDPEKPVDEIKIEGTHDANVV